VLEGNISMIVKLHNLRTGNKVPGKSIYCGRGGPWGNDCPDKMKDGYSRDHVCDWFDKDFRERLENDEEFKDKFKALLNSIKHLEEVTLLCFCTPLRCHTETIRAVMLEYLQEEKEIGLEQNPEPK
jgi:hypothetical protein